MKTIFWGIFLVTSGVFLILKHHFNWNVPTFRVIIGLFLLCLGISLLFGGGSYRNANNIIFSEGKLNIASGEKDYNIIFGQGTLDLQEVSIDDKLEMNIIFGSAEIILPKEAAVEIIANSVFSSTELPDGTNLSFGDRTYLSDPAKKGKRDMTVEVNTVFGSTKIRH